MIHVDMKEKLSAYEVQRKLKWYSDNFNILDYSVAAFNHHIDKSVIYYTLFIRYTALENIE